MFRSAATPRLRHLGTTLVDIADAILVTEDPADTPSAGAPSAPDPFTPARPVHTRVRPRSTAVGLAHASPRRRPGSSTPRVASQPCLSPTPGAGTPHAAR
jgi:hypothetical protein